MTEFLEKVLALETEKDRIAEELRLLKEDYAEEFPMRGVLTAIKVVRARAKLAEHPKEPMPLTHLNYLETLVKQHMAVVKIAKKALLQEKRPR